MQGNVAHNMYPIPVVYQRIFNQLIYIAPVLEESGRVDEVILGKVGS